MAEVLQRPVPDNVQPPEEFDGTTKPCMSPTNMFKLRKEVPAGMGYRQPAEILQRRMPDRVVGGVPQSASFGGITGGRMCVLRSVPDGKTERKKLPQPVLLSFGDGPDARGGNLRMVRGEIYRRQWPGTEILQPELYHRGPIYPTSTAGKPAYPFGVGRGREKLMEAARASGAGKREKQVRLVCRTTSMYTGLDGLTAIIRYHLKQDPSDRSVYVFRDGTGMMLKYIEWDGLFAGAAFQRV